MSKVYINKITKFFPNEPVENADMEKFLGRINGKSSKSKGIVLHSNKIKTRYYALDENGKSTHSNAEMCARAVQELVQDKVSLSDIQVLACGTSSPDSLLPSHASMVHGLIGGSPMEAVSPSGACNAGMLAFKYAWMAVQSGQAENAIAVGSEKMSTFLLARNFEEEDNKIKELNENGYVAFEKDFLRWMLSDGAGATLLQSKPNTDNISLEILWVENRSFAHELETCMYAGGEKDENGNLISWRDYPIDELENRSLLSFKQDVRLLSANIVPTGTKYLLELMKKHRFGTDDFQWFLPHLSSMFFESKIKESTQEYGIPIADEKWFINLPRVGNVGAGSIFLMLEELFNSGKLKKDEQILLMVPESARFSYTYALLRVV